MECHQAFVGDRSHVSIKNTERSRTAESRVQSILNSDQTVPKQWEKFLSCGENKESLVKFLCQHWRMYKSSRFHGIFVLRFKAKKSKFTN